MPFDNPANVGTRVVDNNPVTQDRTLQNAAPGVVVFTKIDLTEAQSFYLKVSNLHTNQAAVCATCTVMLTWYDISGVFIVAQQSYEMNYGNTFFGPITTYINDRCRGSLLTVTINNQFTISGGAVVNPTQEFTLISSTRTIDAPRFYDDSYRSSNQGVAGIDGLLIDFNSTLQANGLTGWLSAGLGAGPVSLEFSSGSAGSGAQLQISWGSAPIIGGSGGGQNGEFSYTIAAATTLNPFVGSPSPRHPLFWQIRNLSATVVLSYNVHMWAN